MTILRELAATAEICGTQLSEAAIEIMLDELANYPDAFVKAALRRCRMETKGRLTLAEIIGKIDDGRPSADEAWALVTWDEETTVVMTEEMAEAQGVCRDLYVSGDKVGARMAFREAYTRIVAMARDRCAPVVSFISRGTSREGAAGPILEAVRRGRISMQLASQHLPPEMLDMTPERPAIPPPPEMMAKIRGYLPSLAKEIERSNGEAQAEAPPPDLSEGL